MWPLPTVGVPPAVSSNLAPALSLDKLFHALVTLVVLNKKLRCRRDTARRATLVSSCYVSRGMGVRKSSNNESDLQGHSMALAYWQWCHSIGHMRFPISLPLQLCLWCQESLVNDPFALKFALKVTHPLSKTTFRRLFAHSASTVLYRFRYIITYFPKFKEVTCLWTHRFWG